MFEIRVICEAADREAVVSGLRSQFTIGRVRSNFSLTSGGERLYITADLRDANPWPTPEQAYTHAPSIIREIGWTTRAAAERPLYTDLGREFWLRKAALLDRIALADEREDAPGDAAQAATEAARRLMDLDSAAGLGPSGHADGPYAPDHPESARDPRGYVRQEFAIWHKNNQ
ncbi:hypothetical protein [Streptomyces sp. V2I9]|uniref:hypothetical protein n=1 Tax=Streptomyces sp. V2I9 TaxID=3042304 RepID=UPI00278B4A5A|nr:hypothetical protein [Streptomyces sp. V2I9]MDQ0985944.1 hypothetical protein [Streptomyces sp. V2I9]